MVSVRALPLIALIVALPAIAQVVRKPVIPLGDVTRDALIVERATAQTARVPRGAVAHARSTPFGGALTPGPLSSFELQFANGDHKLRAVAVEPEGGSASFRLSDRDPDDPITGQAIWLAAKYFKQPTRVEAHGGGDFVIDLPPGPPGHVPLLAGFSFERKARTDANIRTIAVQLIETNGRNRVRVALGDDQGADFRDFAPQNFNAALMSGIPLVGGLIASMYIGGATAAEFGTFSGKSLRLFSARVQVVWAPRAAVLGTASVSGMSRRADSGTLPGANDKVALRGFRLMFANSDHHLRGIGVRLQATGQYDPVLFQDHEADDPIAWSADYARMR